MYVWKDKLSQFMSILPFRYHNLFDIGYSSLVGITELNDIEETRFNIMSIPWFDTYVNWYWYFNFLLEKLTTNYN